MSRYQYGDACLLGKAEKMPNTNEPHHTPKTAFFCNKNIIV